MNRGSKPNSDRHNRISEGRVPRSRGVASSRVVDGRAGNAASAALSASVSAGDAAGGAHSGAAAAAQLQNGLLRGWLDHVRNLENHLKQVPKERDVEEVGAASKCAAL